VAFVVGCAKAHGVCIFVTSVAAATTPSAAAAVVVVATIVVVAPVVVGDITVGAKFAVCVMLDAAFVAVVVVNCLVIAAAVVAADDVTAPAPAPAVGVAVAVVHFSNVVDRQASSEKKKEIERGNVRAVLAWQISVHL